MTAESGRVLVTENVGANCLRPETQEWYYRVILRV